MLARKVAGKKDCYIGGGKLPGWALALATRSTDMSAWLIISAPALAYTLGLEAIWVPVGCYVGSIIQWIFYSRRLREEQERYDAVTTVDYLAKKYRSDTVRLLGALTCLIFYSIYTAAQFAGAGKVMRQVFGTPLLYGVIVSALVIIAYCVAGGFISLVWVDAVHSFLMLITLCATPLAGLIALRSNGASQIGMLHPFGDAEGIGIALLLGTSLSWIFGYLGGEPHFTINQMAVRNERERKQAVALIWGLLTTIGTWLLGAAAFALFGSGAGGSALAGAIAAVMSTVDSELLVASSAVSHGIYCEIIGEGKIGERRALLVSRITIASIGASALIFAIFGSDVVYDLVSHGWSGLAGAFAPSITLSLFWKRFSKAGVYASSIAGILVTVMWISSGLSALITERIASFTIPFLAAVIASLAFPKKD